VQPVLERSDDAEVAAAPPQAPEEVRVFLLAGPQNPAVGCDHIGGNKRPVLNVTTFQEEYHYRVELLCVTLNNGLIGVSQIQQEKPKMFQ
jgi:hypothetical protein